MSHKDAPPETVEQKRMREFFAGCGENVGFGRDSQGNYLASFARLAWAAWQEARRPLAIECAARIDRERKAYAAD